MNSPPSVVQNARQAPITQTEPKITIAAGTITTSIAIRAGFHSTFNAPITQASTIAPCTALPRRRSWKSEPITWNSVPRGRTSRMSKLPSRIFCGN